MLHKTTPSHHNDIDMKHQKRTTTTMTSVPEKNNALTKQRRLRRTKERQSQLQTIAEEILSCLKRIKREFEEKLENTNTEKILIERIPYYVHLTWTVIHFVLGLMIVIVISLALSLAFEVSWGFFTLPICCFGCRRLLSPTDVDDERLRIQMFTVYKKVIGKGMWYGRGNSMMSARKCSGSNSSSNIGNAKKNVSKEDYELMQERERKRERAQKVEEARAEWRKRREEQEANDDPHFVPLPSCELWPHRPVFIRSSRREPTQICLNNSWSSLVINNNTVREEDFEINNNDNNNNNNNKDNAASELNISSSNAKNNSNNTDTNEWDDAKDTCPVNTETYLEFETCIFKGKVVCRFHGIEGNTPEQFYKVRGNVAFQVVVQGEFKERVRMDKVLTGGEFKRPYENIPPRMIVHTGQELFKVITPGLTCDVLAQEPYYLALLGGLVSQMRVDTRETAPDVLDFVLPEQCDMIGPGTYFNDGKHLDINTRGSRRNKELANPATAQKYFYEPGLVYTFDNMQSYLHLDTYTFDVGKVLTLKLERHLRGQPIQFFAKTADGRYLFCFEMWHEKLLPFAPECSEDDFIRFYLEGKTKK